VTVAVYPADLGGCGHYRLIWPAEALIAAGEDVRLIMPGDPGQLEAVFKDDEHGAQHLVDVVPPDADVVVFQRPLSRTLADSVPLLQAHGIRVVVEIDDDFASISRRNTSWRSVHPSISPDRNFHHLAHACRHADLVTVTTKALAGRYGAHGRFAILPNCVPERYLSIEREPHDGVIVGWSGSVDTHPDDLQVTRGGVGRALRSTGATFAVVGTGKGVQRRLDLPGPPVAVGWLPIDDYPDAMAQLDVGIVPLEQSAFNEAKSWLKGLEFAALGVPFVASPTGPYRGLMAEDIGWTAGKPREWERLVARLATEHRRREELAAAWRMAAAEWTVERNAWRWMEAWASVNSRCAL
jgi:glycosyltransferase involved in cell wall biosynthesis